MHQSEDRNGQNQFKNSPTINYLKKTHFEFNNIYGLKNKRMGKVILCKYWFKTQEWWNIWKSREDKGNKANLKWKQLLEKKRIIT